MDRHHVDEPGWDTLYVRKSSRYVNLPGGRSLYVENLLQLATIHASDPGTGAFTTLVDRYRNEREIFVESVTEARFQRKLVRLGFVRVNHPETITANYFWSPSWSCKSCKYWDTKRHSETFVFVGYEIDVDKAKEIVSDGREVREYPVAELANLIDYPKKDGQIKAFVIHIDDDHVDHVDLDIPIILAPGPSGKSHLVIDGHHRIAKAVKEQRETIGYCMLTSEETRWVE